MKKTISLSAIDKVTKGQVLTNRKDFKHDINSLRVVINNYRYSIIENPFMSELMGKNEILDIVDGIMGKYSISQSVITAILKIERKLLSTWRRETDRVLVNTRKQTSSLKDRIVWVTNIKNGLMTHKEVVEVSGFCKSTVSSWIKNDKEFGIHLDKAIAFRHAKI